MWGNFGEIWSNVPHWCKGRLFRADLKVGARIFWVKNQWGNIQSLLMLVLVTPVVCYSETCRKSVFTLSSWSCWDQTSSVGSKLLNSASSKPTKEGFCLCRRNGALGLVTTAWISVNSWNTGEEIAEKNLDNNISESWFQKTRTEFQSTVHVAKQRKYSTENI